MSMMVQMQSVVCDMVIQQSMKMEQKLKQILVGKYFVYYAPDGTQILIKAREDIRKRKLENTGYQIVSMEIKIYSPINLDLMLQAPPPKELWDYILWESTPWGKREEVAV